jgi:alpha-mannosidase
VKRSRSNNTDFEKARFEVSGHKWMDVSEPEYGFAILNDCKYGWDVLDGIPRLTLLRAPVAPDPQADLGHHVFTYALYPHNEAFGVGVVRQGYELNSPASVDSGEIRQGVCPPLIAVSEPNVIVETVKRSEDGRSVIVRAYEATGQRTACAIDFGFEVAGASLCNLIEEELQEESQSVAISGRRVELEWRPFEVKTLRVTVGPNKA